MKDHLRKYFPQRFEDSETFSLSNKVQDFFKAGQKDTRSKIQCEQLVSKVYEKSIELKLLTAAMRKYGCNFNLLRHVVCERCDNCHGGYDPDTNQIVVCQQSFMTENRIMATMMHEMIHMFDYCRAEFDFNNLEHVACSEIRAANLTYCSISDKFTFGDSGFFEFKKAHRKCVEDVAFQSVKAYSPETDQTKIWDIVQKVFPACYNDLEPFGRRPLSGTQGMRQSYRERYYYGYV